MKTVSKKDKWYGERSFLPRATLSERRSIRQSAKELTTNGTGGILVDINTGGFRATPCGILAITNNSVDLSVRTVNLIWRWYNRYYT